MKIIINFKTNKIMTLEECKNNIGRKVTYIPFDPKDRGLQETGVISKLNDLYQKNYNFL